MELIAGKLTVVGEEDRLQSIVSCCQLFLHSSVVADGSPWTLGFGLWLDDDGTIQTVHDLSLVVSMVEVYSRLVCCPLVEKRVSRSDCML